MGTVSCIIVRNVFTAIRESGGDERRVMAELDLSPKSLDDPDARFDMGVVERLWKLAPQMTNDDAFGLHAGERRDRGSHGIVEFWIGASPTFREGLERFCRFYGLLSDVGTLELVDDGKTARLSLRLAKGPIRQAAEYFMAVVITVIRRQVGHP